MVGGLPVVEKHSSWPLEEDEAQRRHGLEDPTGDQRHGQILPIRASGGDEGQYGEDDVHGEGEAAHQSRAEREREILSLENGALLPQLEELFIHYTWPTWTDIGSAVQEAESDETSSMVNAEQPDPTRPDPNRTGAKPKALPL